MGGYGVTEDCPGFLGQKWMDAQLEATYEGPEAVQRLQLSLTMTNEVFLAQLQDWMAELARIAALRPGTGACTLLTGMKLWLWTLNHLQTATDADGSKLYHKSRQSVTFPLADALCWLLAARQFILDLRELEEKGSANPALAEGLPGFVNFFSDLCHVQCARAAGEVGRICAELVHGYNRHPSWDEAGRRACWSVSDIEELEEVFPELTKLGSSPKAPHTHAEKEGPCVGCEGSVDFRTMRAKLDGCITGAYLAKDRAAEALAKVMIPEALDYPV
jgi:alkylation response protein AidB-like acyl-CoA dehydrogenase